MSESQVRGGFWSQAPHELGRKLANAATKHNIYLKLVYDTADEVCVCVAAVCVRACGRGSGIEGCLPACLVCAGMCCCCRRHRQ